MPPKQYLAARADGDAQERMYFIGQYNALCIVLTAAGEIDGDAYLVPRA